MEIAKRIGDALRYAPGQHHLPNILYYIILYHIISYYIRRSAMRSSTPQPSTVHRHCANEPGRTPVAGRLRGLQSETRLPAVPADINSATRTAQSVGGSLCGWFRTVRRGSQMPPRTGPGAWCRTLSCRRCPHGRQCPRPCAGIGGLLTFCAAARGSVAPRGRRGARQRARIATVLCCITILMMIIIKMQDIVSCYHFVALLLWCDTVVNYKRPFIE